MVVLVAPQAGSAQGWEDDFDWSTLNERWTVSGWGVPGYIPDNHVGIWDANNVRLQAGYLVLRLTQEPGQVDDNPNGVISSGALVATTDTYGYGTYEWRMRMTSTATDPTGVGLPVSGSVSAGFLYVNNSETEIDFEFGGHLIDDPDFPDPLYMVNWHNTDPSSDPSGAQQTFTVKEVPGINDMFHTYRFVWEPGRISFYVDDVLEATHTTNVPSAPAHFMINHWGTNKPNWGGEATLGVDRYFYIDWVSYSPVTDPDDTTPPIISGVEATSVSSSGATIAWTTDEPGDSQVEYGTTTSYGNLTPLDTSPVTAHAQSLSGLQAGTAYHYRVHSNDANGNLASSGDFTFTTSPPDTTPPVISSVSSSGISAREATISWATNEPADTQVEYGQTTAYGKTTALNTSLVTSHTQIVGGLSKGTLYHYRVHSRDTDGNLASSDDFTFTTKGKKSDGGGSDPPPPGTGFTLFLTGQKVKGVKTVMLTWDGASSASVDIFRNGTILTTTANDGSHIDSLGKGSASTYTYQVCEAGTSTCSNQASITF
jgi:beta-glucanase (GH16 family)